MRAGARYVTHGAPHRRIWRARAAAVPVSLAERQTSGLPRSALTSDCDLRKAADIRPAARAIPASRSTGLITRPRRDRRPESPRLHGHALPAVERVRRVNLAEVSRTRPAHVDEVAEVSQNSRRPPDFAHETARDRRLNDTRDAPVAMGCRTDPRCCSGLGGGGGQWPGCGTAMTSSPSMPAKSPGLQVWTAKPLVMAVAAIMAS